MNNIKFILSSDRPNLDNESRKTQLMNVLKSAGFNPIIGRGAYQGTLENSFLIESSEDAESLITAIASEFEQDCILKIYPDNKAQLVFPNGNRVDLGTLVECTANEALFKDFSFFNNQFFIVEQFKAA